MSIYNDKTKNTPIEVALLERNERYDHSEWEIKTTSDIQIDAERFLPAGTTFKYYGEFDESAEDARDYVENRGILSACDNVNDGVFETMLEEYGEEA